MADYNALKEEMDASKSLVQLLRTEIETLKKRDGMIERAQAEIRELYDMVKLLQEEKDAMER